MEKKILFPRTTVAGVDMPRMIAGTNWMLGFSHTSSSADELIKMRNYNRDAIVKILEAYDAYGINAAQHFEYTRFKLMNKNLNFFPLRASLEVPVI